MVLLQYCNEQEKYPISFGTVNPNIVQIMGDFPIKTAGFILSREGKEDNWDYLGYTTVYREVEGGAQFSNDGSVYILPEPIPEPEPYVPTLEEVQEAKVAEMLAISNQIIQSGIDVTLSNETVEHFTLTEKEQARLSALRQKVSEGENEIPWHTSDEDEHCKFYSNSDMNLITTAALNYVTWHETYVRDLRIYIRSIDSKEAVEAVTYGMEIPETYRSEPLKAMIAALAV